MAKALTAIAVERIQSHGSSRREIPDARMPGLYLVVQPSGAKSWAVRYRYGGRPKKLTIGSYPAYDLLKARDRARDALQAVDEGRDPAREKRKAKAAAKIEAPDRDLVPAVFSLFVTRWAKPKNRSWKEGARILGLQPDPENPEQMLVKKNGVAARWRDRRIGEITKRDIIDLLDDIVDRGAKTSANRTLDALRTLFGWCVDRDIIASSPCQGVRDPSPETVRDRVLTDDEIRLMWQAATVQGYPFGHLAKLLLLTGQRRQEISGITTDEIDFARRILTIPSTRSKNKDPHEVPLSDPAIAILKSLPRIGDDGLVFTNTGTTTISGFSRSKRQLDGLMLRAAKAEANRPSKVQIARWTRHDLRRTVASGMAALGVAPHVVEAVLNHRSGIIKGVAAVYNLHRYQDEKRTALEGWARYVELLTDNTRWPAVRERLNSSDIEAAKTERARLNVAVMEGGARWQQYLQSLVSEETAA
ncbi:site-specific integrase [Hyphomicrobium sp. B1]|uniref:tyrosine-type recombinase/integrase n=1 Tax=Hyphomicrobium sp. B1 TaxID=3075651 RepID=UPI003C2BE598